MKKSLIISVLLVLAFTGCGQWDDLSIENSVDHWEITRTFETYNNSVLAIDTVNTEYEILSGDKQVLIVTTEKNPVFKEGKELTDLNSTKSILIELDNADSLVTTANPLNSRLFKQLIAFSPDYGITPLDDQEKITLRRKDKSVWFIEAEIYDFEFNGEIDFGANLKLTNKFYDY